MTDELGQPIIGYDYDPFGVATRTNGTSANPFRYTGQYFDNSTGLYYLRARYYDPVTGRFLTQDPFPRVINRPQSMNRYAYVENNAVNQTDPSGKFLPGVVVVIVMIGEGVIEITAADLAIGAATAATLAVEAYIQQHQAEIVAGWEYVGESCQATWENLNDFFAKQKREGAKSKQQNRSLKEIWKEATKGLTRDEAQKIHNALRGERAGAMSADAEDILALRDALFPGKPYPGGWMRPGD